MKTLAIAFAALFLASTASAQNYAGLNQHSPDGQPYDHFGAAVALTDGHGVIGVPDDDVNGLVDAGSVRMMRRNPDLAWTTTVQLVAPVPQAGAHFGAAVAIDGDRLVVGSPQATNGFLHYYRRDASGAWVHVQTFQSFAQPGDLLGTSLALKGRTLLAGAPQYAGPQVRPFRLQESGLWTQLVAGTGSTNGSQFGRSVGVDGTIAIVGAPGRVLTQELGPGLAFIQTASDGVQWGNGTWLQVPGLTGDDAYGWSVAISGTRVIVGAPGRDRGTDVDAGAAYIHELDSNGNWQLVATLDHSYLHAGDRFGTAVALHGNVALVGAPFGDTWGVPDCGLMYLYVRQHDGTWLKRGAYEISWAATGEQYGAAVALFEGGAFAGAPRRVRFDMPESGGSMLYYTDAPHPTRSCPASVNSTGRAARLDWGGSVTAGVSDFRLVVTGAPANRLGLLAMGASATSIPFGDGTLCVGAQLPGSPEPLPLDADGRALRSFDFSSPLGLDSAVTLGSTWRFQVLYRDPASIGAGFNTTDMLTATFAP
ncbi:MAG: hypothetical protein NTV21_08435 [Planctomycetota bacterium]|nr:hypothetical protein [Planctomycetota bacterium]